MPRNRSSLIDVQLQSLVVALGPLAVTTPESRVKARRVAHAGLRLQPGSLMNRNHRLSLIRFLSRTRLWQFELVFITVLFLAVASFAHSLHALGTQDWVTTGAVVCTAFAAFAIPVHVLAPWLLTRAGSHQIVICDPDVAVMKVQLQRPAGAEYGVLTAKNLMAVTVGKKVARPLLIRLLLIADASNLKIVGTAQNTGVAKRLYEESLGFNINGKKIDRLPGTPIPPKA